MTSKKEIKESVDELRKEVSELKTLIHSIPDIGLCSKIDELKESLRDHQLKLQDVAETAKNNIYRLNLMTNELKGIVSMSRAALDEGRKFTEMVEMPRLCRKFSEDTVIHYQLIYKIGEELNDLRLLYDNFKALLHPCSSKSEAKSCQ